jgi:hypothetical protein
MNEFGSLERDNPIVSGYERASLPLNQMCIDVVGKDVIWNCSRRRVKKEYEG